MCQPRWEPTPSKWPPAALVIDAISALAAVSGLLNIAFAQRSSQHHSSATNLTQRATSFSKRFLPYHARNDHLLIHTAIGSHAIYGILKVTDAMQQRPRGATCAAYIATCTFKKTKHTKSTPSSGAQINGKLQGFCRNVWWKIDAGRNRVPALSVLAVLNRLPVHSSNRSGTRDG
jgi:hypothetical protein